MEGAKSLGVGRGLCFTWEETDSRMLRWQELEARSCENNIDGPASSSVTSRAGTGI